MRGEAGNLLLYSQSILKETTVTIAQAYCIWAWLTGQPRLLLQQQVSGSWAIDGPAVVRSAAILPSDSLRSHLAIPAVDVPYVCHATSLAWMQQDEESIYMQACRAERQTGKLYDILRELN